MMFFWKKLHQSDLQMKNIRNVTYIRSTNN